MKGRQVIAFGFQGPEGAKAPQLAQSTLYPGGTRTSANGLPIDGSYYERAAQLFRSAASKAFTFSQWLWLDPAALPEKIAVSLCFNGVIVIGFVDASLFALGAAGSYITIAVANPAEVIGRQVMSGKAWHHLMVAFNSNSPQKMQVCVDGVLETNPYFTIPPAPDALVGLDAPFVSLYAECSNGAVTPLSLNGTNAWCGAAAALWFNDEFMDLSVPANVQKFRTSGGLRADLGPYGRTPTGKHPLIYDPIGNGNNMGRGGVFTPVNAGGLPSILVPP